MLKLNINIYDNTLLFVLLFALAILSIVMFFTISIPKKKESLYQDDYYDQERVNSNGCLITLIGMIIGASVVFWLLFNLVNNIMK